MTVESAVVIEGLEELQAHAKASYLLYTPLRAFMKKAGAASRQAAARQSPKGRTKKYSRSWVEVYGPGDPPESVTVKNTDEPKATWIAGGTRPHLIRATNAHALFWPTARHPVMSVMHPGTKPNDVAGRAALEAGGEIFGPIKDAFDADVEERWNRKGG